MGAEKRKNLRRTVSYPAWIHLSKDAPPQECALCDASEKGAQLAVSAPEKVPENFILALSADGSATRYCRVVWRTESQVGVEFVERPAGTTKRRRQHVGQTAAVKAEAASKTEA
jgi:hypothetical protein